MFVIYNNLSHFYHVKGVYIIGNYNNAIKIDRLAYFNYEEKMEHEKCLMIAIFTN